MDNSTVTNLGASDVDPLFIDADDDLRILATSNDQFYTDSLDADGS